MSTEPGRLNGWAKVIAVALPLAAAALIGWGTLRSDVQHVQRELDRKADAALVALQYAEIVRRLDRIEARMDRIETQLERRR